MKSELFTDDVGAAICAVPERLSGLFRLAAVAARSFADGELRWSNGLALGLADIARLGNMTAAVVQDLFRMLHSAGWLEVLPEPVASAIPKQAELFEPARSAPSFLHGSCTGPVQVSVQGALVVPIPTLLPNTSSIPLPNNQEHRQRMERFLGSGPPASPPGRVGVQNRSELELVRTALPGRLQALGLTDGSKATLTTWDRMLRLAASRGHDAERVLEFIERNVREAKRDPGVRSVGGVVTRRMQQEFGLPRRGSKAGRPGGVRSGSLVEV